MSIDDEVRLLLDRAHDEAWEILTEYREVLDALVVALLEQETLNEKELAEVFAPVRKRDPRPVWHSSPNRPVSAIPPVTSPAQASSGTEDTLPHEQAGTELSTEERP